MPQQPQPPQPSQQPQPQFPPPGGYSEVPPPSQPPAGSGAPQPSTPSGYGTNPPSQPTTGYSPAQPTGYGTGQPPGWTPPPKKSYTGLIIGLVAVLVLFLVAGAAGLWWLISQSSPRDQAADDLTAAFATSKGDSGLTDWCDALFGYDSTMVFEDQNECVFSFQDWFEGMSSTDRDRLAAVTVDSSTLTTIDEETFALRESDLESTGGNFGGDLELGPQEIIYVIQMVESQDGWRIVGVASAYYSAGIVPSEVEDLVYGPQYENGTA